MIQNETTIYILTKIYSNENKHKKYIQTSNIKVLDVFVIPYGYLATSAGISEIFNCSSLVLMVLHVILSTTLLNCIGRPTVSENIIENLRQGEILFNSRDIFLFHFEIQHNR